LKRRSTPMRLHGATSQKALIFDRLLICMTYAVNRSKPNVFICISVRYV
jgi:hypothetical protein